MPARANNPMSDDLLSSDVEAGQLDAAYDHSNAMQQAETERRQRKGRGQSALQILLIGPAIFNWLACCWASWFGTVLVTDTAGVVHGMNLAQTYNFEMVFIKGCTLCIQTILVHFWVTMASVATELQLGTAGSSADGQTFQQRMHRAQDMCARPTRWEWLHIGLVYLDFFFSSLFIFGGVTWYLPLILAIAPGLVLGIIFRALAQTRVVMLQHLRTNTLAFAQQAVRGLMKVLVVGVLLLFNDIGWYFADHRTKWPKCPDHFPNPDPATNSSYLNVAYVQRCKELEPGFFREPLVQTKAGAVFYSGVSNGEVWGHLNGEYALTAYIVTGSFLYYIARAQGILHNRLIDEWELERQHVAVLCLWCIATVAVLILCTLNWNDVTTRAVTHIWGGKCMVSLANDTALIAHLADATDWALRFVS